MNFVLRPIGYVESPLADRADAPKQGDEGTPEAWLVFDASVRDAMRELTVGTEVILLTWLHRASRDVVLVYPRSDRARGLCGVFTTRSPDRPNPIGLHTVQIVAIDDLRVRVRNLEAIDGTPILDVKPVLGPKEQR